LTVSPIAGAGLVAGEPRRGKWRLSHAGSFRGFIGLGGSTTVLLLGFGPLANAPSGRTVALSLLADLAAFLVDVYLY
jgi:hypothetical protein